MLGEAIYTKADHLDLMLQVAHMINMPLWVFLENKRKGESPSYFLKKQEKT